jgi:uncharacterized FAD-dependent dehydrogenase
LLSYTVYKRSYDARHKKNIFFIYSLDVDTSKNTQILEQFSEDTHVKTRPDDRYRFVAQAPENISERPLVVGLGPCGLFAGLILAQMGFKPIILERGKEVRERTVDTFGLWQYIFLMTRVITTLINRVAQQFTVVNLQLCNNSRA